MITSSDLEKVRDHAPLLSKAFSGLLRETKLAAYIETVEVYVSVDKTKTTAHFHCVALDGNGRPRINDLSSWICSHIVDYAIPRSKLADAINAYQNTNSSSRIVRLEKEAKSLFTDLRKTGEGGEILLCFLTEHFLGYPQLISKMPLKTNTKMHYHGADGVHVTVDEVTGKLALYWGESKLYKIASEAIKKCLESISPYLKGDGGSGAPQERDLQLLRDGIDLNDAKLESAIKRFLDPDDPLFKKLQYRGVCLIGFDLAAYPSSPNSKTVEQLIAEIKNEIDDWKNRIGDKIIKEKIDSFVIEVFLLPFPSVEKFREAFLKEMGL